MLLSVAVAVFANVCGDGYSLDSSGKCIGNVCVGGPTTPQQHANYLTCDSSKGCKIGIGCSRMRTGERCDVGCQTGYKKVSGNPFTLECSSLGTYVDNSNINCSPNTCRSPSLTTAQTDYLDCTVNKFTGDSCLPRCNIGYQPVNPLSSFILSCDSKGVFRDMSGLYCQPASCTPPQSPSIDYSSCSNLRTGDTCRIQCLNGYKAIESQQPTGFVDLFCLGDDPFIDMSGFRCSSNRCSFEKPTTHESQPHAMYKSANIINRYSGDIVVVACDVGYQNHGSALTLLCHDDGSYSDFVTNCMPNTCSSHSDSTSVSWLNYTNCINKKTNDICTTTCLPGYTDRTTRTTSTLTLICSGESPDFVAMADQHPLQCEPSFCSRYPTLRKPFADYDSANIEIKRTGDTAIVNCLQGFTNTGGGFILNCGPGGEFTDSGTACTPHRCQGFKTDEIDGSSCEGKYSGEICDVKCVSGHGGREEVFQLDMRCDPNGVLLSDISFTSSCKPNRCLYPVVRKPFVDYSILSINYYQTGSPIILSCMSGYSQLSAATLILECASNNTFVDSSVCVPNNCGDAFPSNLQLVGDGQQIQTDAELQVSCSDGYVDKWGRDVFTTTVFCTNEGVAQLEPVVSDTCTPATCNGLSSDLTINVADCSGKRTGDLCDATCAEGYSPSSGSMSLSITLKCTTEGIAIVGDDLCSPNSCKYLPQNIDLHPHARYPSDRKSTNQLMEVSCLDGYFNNGPAFVVVCSTEGVFTDTSTSCLPHSCKEPIVPQPFTDYSAINNIATGSTLLLPCVNGFHNVGRPLAFVCDSEGLFIDTSSQCVELPDEVGCLEPIVPQPNANYSLFLSNRYPPKSTVKVPCDEGFANVGESIFLDCNPSGFFSDTATRCEPLQCDPSKVISDNHFADYESSFSEIATTGMVVVIHCIDGYGYSHTSNRVTLVCHQDGSFYDDQTICQPNSCLKPSNGIQHANYTLINNQYSTGSIVDVTCYEGYRNTGPPLQLLCTDTGTYDDTSTLCEANPCIAPTDDSRKPFVDYSTLSNTHSGDFISLNCVAGYDFQTPSQSQLLICDERGRFIDRTPACIKSVCSTDVFDNAENVSVAVGDSWVPKCKDGYHIESPSNGLQCVSNGVFSDAIQCIRSFCSTENHPHVLSAVAFVGESTQIICTQGYHLSSTTSVATCLSHQKFNFVFQCIPSVCHSSIFDNAEVSTTPVGAYWRVECAAGFHRNPGLPEYLLCVANNVFNASTECLPSTCSTGHYNNTVDVVVEEGSDWVIECETGYHPSPENLLQVKCVSHNEFSGVISCLRSSCSTNGIPNSELHTIDVGASLEVQCLSGYHSVPPAVVVECVSQGHFNTSVPTCEIDSCSTAAFSHTPDQRIFLGDLWTVSCLEGYHNLKGEQILVCDSNNSFNDTDVVCEPFGCSTSDFNYARNEFVAVGKQWAVQCVDGYKPADGSNLEITCEDPGVFNGVAECILSGCTTNGIPHAVDVVIKVGDSWVPVCNEGRQPSSSIVSCVDTDTFNTTVTCDIPACSSSSIPNSTPTTVPKGQSWNVTCTDGYTTGSVTSVVCDESITLIPSVDPCVPNRCFDPPNPLIRLPTDSIQTGDVILLQCIDGYSNVGSELVLICGENGDFNDNNTICSPNNCLVNTESTQGRNYSTLMGKNVLTGDKALIPCMDGYGDSDGELSQTPLTCFDNGTVGEVAPTCVANNCFQALNKGLFTNYSILWQPEAPPPVSGMRVSTPCLAGYTSDVVNVLVCDSNGFFDASVFGSCSPAIPDSSNSPFYENPLIIAAALVAVVIIAGVVIIIVVIRKRRNRRRMFDKLQSEIEIPNFTMNERNERGGTSEVVTELPNPMRPVSGQQKPIQPLPEEETLNDLSMPTRSMQKSFRSIRSKRAVTLLPTETSKPPRPRRRAQSFVYDGKKSVSFSFDQPHAGPTAARDIQRAPAARVRADRRV